MTYQPGSSYIWNAETWNRRWLKLFETMTLLLWATAGTPEKSLDSTINKTTLDFYARLKEESKKLKSLTYSVQPFLPLCLPRLEHLEHYLQLKWRPAEYKKMYLSLQIFLSLLLQWSAVFLAYGESIFD